MLKKLVELGIIAAVLYLIFIAVQYLVALVAAPGLIVPVIGVILILVFIKKALELFGIDIL
jgi:hypothetical protein